MDELDEVDWSTLVHAYGTGVDPSLQIAGDVSRSLAELRSNPTHAIADGLYSNICHQGTVYQATAHAVPFIAAVAVGDIPDDVRVQLIALLGDISIGASYPATTGSHAGAFGDKVDLLVTRSLAASIPRLSTIRSPSLAALIAAIESLLAAPTDERRGDAGAR